jgi:hypothetical protein
MAERPPKSVWSKQQNMHNNSRIRSAPTWVWTGNPTKGIDIMGKLSFFAGAAVGYVLGAKAGQKRYEQIKGGANKAKGGATKAWSSEPVQAKVDTARAAVKDHVPIIADKVGDAAKLAGSRIKDKVTAEDLPETIHRGSDGRLHADTTGFGPGPDKLP